MGIMNDQPRIIPTRHGFLAVAPKQARFQISVTAATELQAVELYQERCDVWSEVMKRDPSWAAADLPVPALPEETP